MADWHLAQMNVGHIVDGMETPAMADFAAGLDAMNAMAERTPGFVWRLQSESGNATDIKPTDDPRFIVNMSVWKSVEALFDYVYRSSHRDFMVRRREWFLRPAGAYQVLWWIEAGHIPTIAEGLARLQLLEAEGPGQAAFHFKSVFPPPPGRQSRDMEPEPYCVGWR